VPECEGEVCEGGVPATHGIEFDDGEVMWLCAECYDDWMAWIRSETESEDDADSAWAHRVLRLNR
jgi:hypothetical protein